MAKTELNVEEIDSILQSGNAELLEAGADGKYYRIVELDVIVKRFSRGDDSCYLRELTTLQLLSSSSPHANIMRFLGHRYEAGGKSFIVLECYQCTLDVLLYKQIDGHTATYSVGNALSWSGQLANAVAYLHNLQADNQRHAIMHRDVKPQNGALFENFLSAKLIDFALARPDSDDEKSFCGTMDYMAPEVEDGQYDVKCDVYSAGVTIRETFNRSTAEPDLMPAVVREIYDNCLLVDPLVRPSMMSIAQKMRSILEFCASKVVDFACVPTFSVADDYQPPSGAEQLEQLLVEYNSTIV